VVLAGFSAGFVRHVVLRPGLVPGIPATFIVGTGPLLAHAVGRDRKDGARVANLVTSIRIVSILVTAAVSGAIGISVTDSPTVSTLMIVFAIALVGRAASMWADQMYQAYEVTNSVSNRQKFFEHRGIARYCACPVDQGRRLGGCWACAGLGVQGAWGMFLVTRHLQPLTPKWHWLEIRLLLIACIPIGLSNVFDALMVQGGSYFTRVPARE